MSGHSFTRKVLKFAGRFLLLAITASPLVAETGYPVDLNELPIYVRTGFSPDEIKGNSLEVEPDQRYKRIDADRNRPLIIPEMGLNGLPEREFPEFRTLPAEHFTVLWRFRLSESDLHHMKNPVLLLAQLGEGWEIYLNGQLLGSSIKDYPTNRRLIRVAINPRLLVNGMNQIAIHLVGDPLSRETGLYYGAPYRIEEAFQAEEAVGQKLYLILITIYASIGIFHMLFMLADRKRVFSLHFGLFALTLSIYLFTRSTLAYYFTDNATMLFRIEMAAVAFCLPAFVNFTVSLLPNRSISFRYFGPIVVFHGITISALSLIVPVNLLYDLLVAWQFSIPFFLLVLQAYLIAFFLKDLRWLIRQVGFIKGFFQTLAYRASGNLVLGMFFIAVTTMYDIYAAMFLHTSPGLSTYGLLAFVTGSAMRMAYDLLGLLKTNQKLNKSLRHYIQNLRGLHRTLTRSEEKYRRLIEETNDIVMTLDGTGIVTAANSSVFRELGLRPADLVGRPFTTLLQEDVSDETGFSQGFTIERVQAFYNSGDSLNIRVPIFARQKKGHIFFDVKFEKIRTTEESDIFVKASTVAEDPALKYLVRESIHFQMTNDIFAIEDMVRRLIVDLPRFLDEYEISMIRIGLREIIVNAIEHGNLGITYIEKTELLNAGNYQEEIRRRMNTEVHGQRMVRIRLTLTPRQIRYRISDEGTGFDHRIFGFDVDADDTAASLHGRGIFIARNAFTSVMYNTSGNSVLLVRNFPEKADPA